MPHAVATADTSARGWSGRWLRPRSVTSSPAPRGLPWLPRLGWPASATRRLTARRRLCTIAYHTPSLGHATHQQVGQDSDSYSHDTPKTHLADARLDYFTCSQ